MNINIDTNTIKIPIPNGKYFINKRKTLSIKDKANL